MCNRVFILGNIILVAALAGVNPVIAEEEAAKADALALFEQRLTPIFRSPKPSSCVQCHLASVDLKNYILPSAEQTFASLRDQGLIDLNEPAKSKILTLIQMGEKDLDRGAKLIHAKTRQAEYEAFAAWIEACAGDRRFRDLPPLAAGELAKPARPDAIIRHNRKDRVLDSFVRNVWSQRMRCFPCHTPFELDATVKSHPKARENHRQFEEQFGQRMNIFRQTPEATLRQLIASSRKPAAGHLPLINVKEPAQSLLVLKPTSKLPAKDDDGKFAKPSYTTPVTHMGGLKMFVDDHSYKAFLAWIEDYARVVADEYASTGELPADDWRPTQAVLRLSDAPASWPDFTPVQLFVHAWDAKTAGFSARPIAFTQGIVTPRRMVNGTLFLIGKEGRSPESDSADKALAPGKYLIKAYVDRQHRLAADPSLFLSGEEFVGQAKIEARWQAGFKDAEILSAGRLKNGLEDGAENRLEKRSEK